MCQLIGGLRVMTSRGLETNASQMSEFTGNDFPMVNFGGTGISVSRLGFGGMELAGPPRSPDLTQAEATRLLHAAFDFGINYFDTSIDYGLSEERIGAAFRKTRDRIILASKCGCRVGNDHAGEGSHVFTAANIRAGVTQSLRRLETDHIDVMQLHGNPTRKELEEQGGLETLLELQQRGIIRHIGLSGRKPYVQEFLDLDFMSVFQLPYSAIQRQHEDIADQLSDRGKAVVARGVVGRGSVAKRWSAIPIGMADGQAQSVWESANIDEILGGMGMSRIEFMIRFALTNEALDLCLTGTTNISHLEENVLAAEKGPLDPEIHALVVQRLTVAGSAPGDGEYRRGGPKPPVEPK